jgi:hypothetical protein
MLAAVRPDAAVCVGNYRRMVPPPLDRRRISQLIGRAHCTVSRRCIMVVVRRRYRPCETCAKAGYSCSACSSARSANPQTRRWRWLSEKVKIEIFTDYV